VTSAQRKEQNNQFLNNEECLYWVMNSNTSGQNDQAQENTNVPKQEQIDKFWTLIWNTVVNHNSEAS
jgi:hypothetical protein